MGLWPDPAEFFLCSYAGSQVSQMCHKYIRGYLGTGWASAWTWADPKVLGLHWNKMCLSQPRHASIGGGRAEWWHSFRGESSLGDELDPGGGTTSLGDQGWILTPIPGLISIIWVAQICTYSSPLGILSHTTRGKENKMPLLWDVLQPTPNLHWIQCRLLGLPVPAKVSIVP